MLGRLLNWFRSRDDEDDDIPAPNSALVRSGAFAPPAAVVRPSRPGRSRPQPQQAARPSPKAQVRVTPGVRGQISDLGPGKNVLVAPSNQPEDENADDVLALLDDAGPNRQDEGGIDPYNTGKFDRSKNWDKRFR